MDLTPEERERIYLEEKARREAASRRSGLPEGSGALFVLGGAILLGVVIWCETSGITSLGRDQNRAPAASAARPAPRPAPPTPSTIEGRISPFPVPGEAVIDGRDLEATPPLTVQRVNLWDGVPRTRVIDSIMHGVRVDILAGKWNVEEDRFYFQVRAGSEVGWVPESFLSSEAHPRVGELVQ